MSKGSPKKNKAEKVLEIVKEAEKPEIFPEATPLTKEQKEKKVKLHRIMSEINKEYKTSHLLHFAKDEPDKERLPFGIPEIDELTGNGGVAGNYIIIWGQEAVGKSSLALYQIAEAQRRNKICVYLDLEHGFFSERAKLFGVNLDELILIEDIDNAEQAMDVVIKLAKEQVVDLMVVDSIQSFSPKAEQESKGGKERLMEEDEIALLAKKMGKFLRRTSNYIYKSKIGITLIGQSRTGGIGGFATHEELTGGRGAKHWSLLTVFMRRGTGTDAPTAKVETGEMDENGKPIKILKKIGFDCVIHLQKVKVKAKTEGSDLHLPFYFDSGFFQKEKKDETS